MKKNRISALILALLMLGLSTASCSDTKGKDTDVDSAEAGGQDESESEAAKDDGTTSYYDGIAAVDYNGWNFNISTWAPRGDALLFFTVEESTGEQMNDAMYNRVVAIEDKFNIVVNDFVDRDTADDIQKSVRAGTKDWALGFLPMDDGSTLMTSDCITSFTDMSVDLDQPYWDQGAIDTLTINGKMYYGLSDITFDHYESCSILFYNGQLLENNLINESPYDLYMDGKWTLEAMYGMMETVSRDLNGDGAMTEGDDVFGLVGRKLRHQAALPSSNIDIISYSEADETYVINTENETLIAVGEMLNKMTTDTNICIIDGDYAKDEFTSGRALFDSHLLADFRGYRDNEDDYGIVTWPSLEENTDGKVYVRNPHCLVVPVGLEDYDMLSTILDAFAAYSCDYIIEEYIDRAVIGKGARDSESAAMIRDMIGRRYYDIAYPFGFDIVIESWERAVDKNTYASSLSKVEKMFNSLAENALAPYFED